MKSPVIKRSICIGSKTSVSLERRFLERAQRRSPFGRDKTLSDLVPRSIPGPAR